MDNNQTEKSQAELYREERKQRMAKQAKKNSKKSPQAEKAKKTLTKEKTQNRGEVKPKKHSTI